MIGNLSGFHPRTILREIERGRLAAFEPVKGDYRARCRRGRVALTPSHLDIDALVSQFAKAVASELAPLLDRTDQRQSPWMRTDEAIEYTRIPAGTFRNLMAAGQIPSHGGRTKLFHRDELDQVLLGYRPR